MVACELFAGETDFDSDLCFVSDLRSGLNGVFPEDATGATELESICFIKSSAKVSVFPSGIRKFIIRFRELSIALKPSLEA